MPKKKVLKSEQKQPPITTPDYLVCDKCFKHVSGASTECTFCDGKKLAPEYVRELRKINRSVSVRITKPFEGSLSDSPSISLYKWWPGGKANFNIKSPGQWEAIKKIIDEELGPILGWISEASAIQSVDTAITSTDLSEVASQHPDQFAKLVAALKVHIDLPTNEENDKLYAAIADLVTQFDKASIGRVTNLITEIKKDGTDNIRQLDEALANWSLTQVTAVVRETQRRLATIELLRTSLKDESTFELRGDNSIHSILERDLWLLDEAYWMIQSNRTLKTFIGDQLSIEDKKKYGKKRPDFVCGTLGDQLIIVELKRPSHDLTKDDLNQLEEYLAVSKKYSLKTKSQRGFLLGSRISEEVRTYLQFRRGVTVLNYWEILDAAEKRYKEFLKKRGR